MAAKDTRHQIRLKNPPSAPSGVTRFFPVKKIMDIRNELTWEVLTGCG